MTAIDSDHRADVTRRFTRLPCPREATQSTFSAKKRTVVGRQVAASGNVDAFSTGPDLHEAKGAFDFDTLQSAIADVRAKQVFFVCGAVKSGTTWLQLMLDAHPEVSCGGEGHFADRLDPLLTKAWADYNHAVGAKNRHIFGQLPLYPVISEDHRLYLLACAIKLLLAEQSNGKRAMAVGEKTPDTIRYLGLLSHIFPDAKFIHIVRDGRDYAVSCWFHNLRLFQERTRQHFGSIDSFAASFADTWAAEVSAAVRFGEAQPDRFMAVRYEDLIADGENSAQGLFAFLGVYQAGLRFARRRQEHRPAFENIRSGANDSDKRGFTRARALRQAAASGRRRSRPRLRRRSGLWLVAR
jgi:hypothetical protein